MSSQIKARVVQCQHAGRSPQQACFHNPRVHLLLIGATMLLNVQLRFPFCRSSCMSSRHLRSLGPGSDFHQELVGQRQPGSFIQQASGPLTATWHEIDACPLGSLCPEYTRQTWAMLSNWTCSSPSFSFRPLLKPPPPRSSMRSRMRSSSSAAGSYSLPTWVNCSHTDRVLGAMAGPW